MKTGSNNFSVINDKVKFLRYASEKHPESFSSYQSHIKLATRTKFLSMRRLVIQLLLLVFSLQVIAAAAGEHAIAGKNLFSQEIAKSQPTNHLVSLDAYGQSDFDETQAKCAVEEMSDYVVLELNVQDESRCAQQLEVTKSPFVSIILPRPIPPPRF
ncbi:hypothetical protein ACFQUU_24105 [Herbaspirillum sp. GCM10030257]|uniref:hypothetical protein n=1 Tax=Herbaspirillum sp. GCM10030257 TaxID=3273393 RepID=UPI003606A0C5